MTTGTTTNYEDNRTTIITDAMFLLGVQEAGETIADADMQLAVRWLNRMVKKWQATGIHVWANSYATLFLESGANEYTLGNETQGGAHWATAPIEQALTADAAAAATTLQLDSTDLTVGDHIGIVNDDNGIQWTTVATKPNATSVTISAALTDASAEGNYVYSYTSRPSSGAPLRILQANRKTGLDAQTSTIIMPGLAFLDFFQLTNKLGAGTPVNWSYQKDVNIGNLKLWPNPDDCTVRMVLQYTRPLYNFDNPGDTQDIAQEWLTAIIYNLAVLLAPSYGKSSLLPTLAAQAQAYLDEANTYDQEAVSIYLSPTQYRY